MLLNVARKYYLEGESQAEIADSVNFSRPSVSRLLTEARRRGIVQIQISHPLERLTRLEARLADHFGLEKARVADSPFAAGEIVRCAATLLVESCREDSLITVSNGRVVAAIANAVPRMGWINSRVVQMTGSLSGHQNRQADSSEVCRRLAARLGGSFHELPVPFVLSSSVIAAQMRSEEPIAATLELGAAADVALVEVGAVREDALAADTYPSPDLVLEMAKTGAVAHIVGHYVSEDGNHLSTPLCERAITVDLEQMKKIPLVIAVAWGHEKIPAIKAVMKGGFISALVTDRSTAERLLYVS